MTVSSSIQTQYTSQTQSTSSNVQETPKNNQQTRYEILLSKNYDNMSEVERRELSYYSAMRPVKYLDEAGNAALDKALEGKTDAEKFSIKGMLELVFMTSVKSNAQGGLDRQKFDSVDTSTSANISRFEKFMDDYRKGGQGVDPLGIADVVLKFLDIYTNSDSTKDIKNQEDSVVDKFLKEVYSKSSITSASAITKENIQNRVNEYAQTLTKNQADTPELKLEISKMVNDYKKELLNDYKKSLEDAKNGDLSLEQQAIIKVLLDENTKEASSLEKLLATKDVAATDSVTATSATSATDNVTKTEATGRMAQMQEKYKDVYTPTPETYSASDEELQTRKIYEAYPDYIDFRDFLKIVNSYYDELGGKKMELGQTITQDQIDKQEIAFQKAYDLFGGEEEYMLMMKGVQEIQAKYPYNSLAKDGVHNATEIARFQNAAIYEGLEQGKTVEEAKIYAANLSSSFMDTSYTVVNFLTTLIKAGRADSHALEWFYDEQNNKDKQTQKIDFNAPNNSVMDLKKYGIEGNWESYNIVENQKKMIAEVEMKIEQYNFMLHNEELIKEAYTQLDPSYQDIGNNAGYKKLIHDDYMPRMQEGLNIFKKYKIYD
ncbi:MAG: hypothetical protein Q7S59_07830 [Sulfurimonas sp.]|nr:hypothetical protein [Sulfurimonas sp.]